jgi:hypothetical protein
MHSSWIYQRDYKALLRSTGHLFKDGRWTDDDTGSFHVYREYEPACVSENHPFTFPSYEAEGLGDFPGTERNGNFRVCVTRGYDSSRYYGPIADVPIPDPVEPDYGDFVLALNEQGTKFIKSARPGNPSANLFQFVGELRQIPQLPRLRRLGLETFRDLGSNYLNVEFGWKPFVGDLVDMYNTQRKLEKTLQKLRENNGLIIRRRQKPRTTTTTSVQCEGSLSVPFGHLGDTTIGGNSLLEGYFVGGPTGVADLGLYTFTGQCDYNYSVHDTLTTWSCGNFGYYVPDIGSSQWTERAKRALFGQNPTPSQLWELIPWSWLIDWFSNVGDIMSNLSGNAVDNETWTNCFAMRTITRQHVITVSTHWDHLSAAPFGVVFDVPAGSTSLVYSRYETNKLRRQASPYGFGLSWPDFSLRQLAILAALGISRK